MAANSDRPRRKVPATVKSIVGPLLEHVRYLVAMASLCGGCIFVTWLSGLMESPYRHLMHTVEFQTLLLLSVILSATVVVVSLRILLVEVDRAIPALAHMVSSYKSRFGAKKYSLRSRDHVQRKVLEPDAHALASPAHTEGDSSRRRGAESLDGPEVGRIPQHDPPEAPLQAPGPTPNADATVASLPARQ